MNLTVHEKMIISEALATEKEAYGPMTESGESRRTEIDNILGKLNLETNKTNVLYLAELLVEQHEDLVMRKAARLYDSGGVDVEAFKKGGHALPKVLVTAALRDSTEMFVPKDEEFSEIINNLKHF